MKRLNGGGNMDMALTVKDRNRFTVYFGNGRSQPRTSGTLKPSSIRLAAPPRRTASGPAG
jgi:hypothetical protein